MLFNSVIILMKLPDTCNPARVNFIITIEGVLKASFLLFPSKISL